MSTLFERLARRWRHLRTTNSATRTMFPQATLDDITSAITAGERTHRGELRFVVETALPAEAIWHGMEIRRRALALFAEHGVWDTADNCGVLLYVNVAERKVEIVADRAINARVAPEEWQAVCAAMTAGFAQGRFHAAALEAVAAVNALLQRHFPAEGARSNELPDAPLLL
ncbi:MAG: TPM domain-containing protein [Telluria sp.]|jgi:uncharacterized membrane protein